MNPSIMRAFIIVWIVLLFGMSAPPAITQTWTFTGSMNSPRTGATGTRLLDGRVLVAGGADLAGNFLSSAEIYNPATGTWTLTSPMVQPQGGAVAVLLNDGRVLVYGGNIAGGPGGVTNLAQIFDPQTGLWTATGSMNQCRQSFTGTLLANGQAMAVGGYCGGYLSSAELYNPSTGTWSLTGSLPGPVANASATLLPNGKVLVAGGTTGFAVRTAELFDPNSGAWTLTGSLNQARGWNNSHLLSGTILLNSGQVLAVAGVGGSGCGSFLSSVELYNPVAGTWAFTGSRSMALDQHRLVLLSDGRVLASGGVASDCSTYTNIAEIYDPSSGAWTATASLNQARAQHAAASLLDGRVLVAGGNNASMTFNSAEILGPKYNVCVLYDQTKSVKSGAVFPIKVALCDVNGTDVSSSAVVLHATAVMMVSVFVGTPDDAGNANPDNDFRFDSTLGTTGGYIFNLSTSGLASGTYSLQFTAAGDLVTHSVNFGVK